MGKSFLVFYILKKKKKMFKFSSSFLNKIFSKKKKCVKFSPKEKKQINFPKKKKTVSFQLGFF